MVRVYTDGRCELHEAPPGYPERPERLRRIVDGLRRAGREVVEVRAGRDDLEAAVLALHAEPYVRRFRRAVERGDGLLDSADNPLSPQTWTAAWAAVETVLDAADWVADGADRTAFAAVRPPGHHAEAESAMGFCFFNNLAVAAESLRRRHGCERVAIFDFDVHHGNGTQHLFEERCDVLYVSTHQFPFYPGTGGAGEIGHGAGAGCTVNVPLPAGTGDAGYAAALDERVLPALRRFAPEVLLVSAGFDAWQGDPLGGMKVSEAGFHAWGASLGALAAELCDGRLLMALEGGYDLAALPTVAEACLRGAAGEAGSG